MLTVLRRRATYVTFSLNYKRVLVQQIQPVSFFPPPTHSFFLSVFSTRKRGCSFLYLSPSYYLKHYCSQLRLLIEFDEVRRPLGPNINRIMSKIKETERGEASSWPPSLQVDRKMSRIVSQSLAEGKP